MRYLSIILILLSQTSFSQNPLVKQWDNTFGGNTTDDLTTLKMAVDNGFLLGGNSYSGISGNKTAPSQGFSDYWIVKTNDIGVKQWDKSFGGSNEDNLNAIIITPDSNYLLGGSSSSPVSGDKSQPSQGALDYWVVKMDTSGNKIWDKTFGGNGNDYLQSIQSTADGGFILGGFSFSGISGDKTQPNKGVMDYWIIKIDSAGTKSHSEMLPMQSAI